MTRIGFWLLWFSFIAYSLFLAPPLSSDLAGLQNLWNGNEVSFNPVVIAIFSLIGMWIAIYSCLMFADGRMQKIPAWVFLLASLGSGVIGLIPYLALRQPAPFFVGHKDGWLRFWDSRRTGILISISTVCFILYGVFFGDWAAFVQQLQTSRFVNAMSLAFCLFGLLFPSLLGDDMSRRGWHNSTVFWAVSLLPLVGALVYICTRPQLIESSAAQPKPLREKQIV